MACRGSIIVLLAVLPGCAADNPLFGYGVLQSGDSEGDTDGIGDDDDDDDDEETSGMDEDQLPGVCSGAAPGEFGLDLEVESELCTGVVRWDCRLDYDAAWMLNDCCPADEVCDVQYPSIALEFHTPAPDVNFAGHTVNFHAFLTGGDGGCSAAWVEIVSGAAPIPLYAGASTHGPQLDSLAVAYVEPEEADRCACSDDGQVCCDRPPGPYDLAFNLPAFSDMFPGVVLGQGEVWDSPIGDFGHPLIEVFSAFRDSGCQRDLKVDWFLTLQRE